MKFFSLQDVVQVKVLLTNIADFAAVNTEYGKYFKIRSVKAWST